MRPPRVPGRLRKSCESALTRRMWLAQEMGVHSLPWPRHVARPNLSDRRRPDPCVHDIGSQSTVGPRIIRPRGSCAFYAEFGAGLLLPLVMASGGDRARRPAQKSDGQSNCSPLAVGSGEANIRDPRATPFRRSWLDRNPAFRPTLALHSQPFLCFLALLFDKVGQGLRRNRTTEHNGIRP